MPLTQKVLVNGVTVDFFDDTKPATMFPMRATLSFIEDSPYAEANPEAIAALRKAGVESLPLYRTQAEKAGVEWEEIV